MLTITERFVNELPIFMVIEIIDFVKLYTMTFYDVIYLPTLTYFILTETDVNKEINRVYNHLYTSKFEFCKFL